MLIYAVFGILIYYVVTHYLLIWMALDTKRSSTTETKIVIGVLAFLSSSLILNFANIRHVVKIDMIATDFVLILTCILYFIGVKLFIPPHLPATTRKTSQH
ncbi:MAG: hypothetical protein GY801_31515 [bacterium]|nr:hypothetical protein [bacterium]